MAMRRLRQAAPAAILVLIVLLCTVPVHGSIVITDDMRDVVTISSPAQRIVSLAPSNTEILGALGLMDRVYGVTDYCNYPIEALEKPKVGGFSSVNVEKVVALKPDLVLTSPSNGKETVARLRELGLTVIVLNPVDIDEVFTSIHLVGTATGTTARADDLITSLKSRLAAVHDAIACTSDRPKVAHVVWYDPIWVSGNQTYQDEVIRYAGGTNAFAGIAGWGTVSLEEFIVNDPDYILVNEGTGMTNATDNADPVYEYFFTDSRLLQLKAVRENYVILVDTDTISRGGPRIIDAVEQVARAIHPECYTPRTPQIAAATEALPAQTPGFTGLAAGCGCILFVTMRRRGKKP
jgi:iron complex transport system substrate-binding protein